MNVSIVTLYSIDIALRFKGFLSYQDKLGLHFVHPTVTKTEKYLDLILVYKESKVFFLV